MVIPNDIRRDIEYKLDNDPKYEIGLSTNRSVDLDEIIYAYAIIGEREEAARQARRRKSAEDIMRERNNSKPRTDDVR